MRVLLITPTFPPDVGGGETMLKDVAAFLGKRGHAVHVITHTPLMARARASLEESYAEGVRVHRVPWPGHGLFNVFETFPPLQFAYLVPGVLTRAFAHVASRANRPDVVNAYGLSGAFVGMALSRALNLPLVVDLCTTYRFSDRPALGNAVRHILRAADHIRGNGPGGRREVIALGFDPAIVGMNFGPVDETVFAPMDQSRARAIVGLPGGGFVGLFAGRMVPSKGVEIALHAVRRTTCKTALFVFIGDGPLRPMVEQAAAQDSRIRTVHSVKHHELVPYYNAADVLIRAPVDEELLAYVGREALMCGLPIMAPAEATYFGIARQVDAAVVPPHIGWLLPPDPDAFARHIDALSAYHAEHGRLPVDRTSCREFALRTYSHRILEQIETDYRRAIEGRRARTRQRFVPGEREHGNA